MSKVKLSNIISFVVIIGLNIGIKFLINKIFAHPINFVIAGAPTISDVIHHRHMVLDTFDKNAFLMIKIIGLSIPNFFQNLTKYFFKLDDFTENVIKEDIKIDGINYSVFIVACDLLCLWLSNEFIH